MNVVYDATYLKGLVREADQILEAKEQALKIFDRLVDPLPKSLEELEARASYLQTMLPRAFFFKFMPNTPEWRGFGGDGTVPIISLNVVVAVDSPASRISTMLSLLDTYLGEGVVAVSLSEGEIRDINTFLRVKK